MADTYYTIQSPAEGFFRDRGSKFLAYAYPVWSESNVQACLEALRKLHPKARHHCYAYRLGKDGAAYRANDDGEPSGTAGRPILGQIDSAGLTNVLVVVIRYFGGTLLGASGLIQAYKIATQDAFQNAEKVEKIVSAAFDLSFNYANMSDVMNLVKKLDLTVLEQHFNDLPRLVVSVRQAEQARVEIAFAELADAELVFIGER